MEQFQDITSVLVTVWHGAPLRVCFFYAGVHVRKLLGRVILVNFTFAKEAFVEPMWDFSCVHRFGVVFLCPTRSSDCLSSVWEAMLGSPSMG